MFLSGICGRLLYRSKQRGFLELDLVLGRWVEEHIHSMDENGIKALVDVLDLVKFLPFFTQIMYLLLLISSRWVILRRLMSFSLYSMLVIALVFMMKLYCCLTLSFYIY